MKNKKFRRRAILTMLLVTLLILPFWVNKHFGHMDFIQVLFLALSDPQGGVIEWSMIFSFLLTFVPFYIMIILIFNFYAKISKNNYIHTIRDKEINFRIHWTNKRVLIATLLVVSITLLNFNRQLKIFSFFIDSKKPTDLYEQYYADPEDTKLTWPLEKQNVIHIILESMEVGFSDVEVDNKTVNLIPKLEQLSKENTSFKMKEGFTGAMQLKGTSWTVASLLAQTAGVPIQISNMEAGFGEKYGFLPGVMTLGEILEQEGYTNYFMAGSDANFGGRETYFKSHGNYKILDTKYYKETKQIPEDYNVFWGFEDKKLFEFAKDELTYLASNAEPFNLTMLTVDSHFTDGYTDPSCSTDYSVNYANALACSDNQITAFVKWIQEQDFYDNTTIIITGDHFTMNHDFSSNFNDQDRSIYNTILNPKKDLKQVKTENRLYSSLDIFPTTLSAMGVEIEGNRLGLGTDLFSDEKTLIEKLGFKVLEEKIGMHSSYYNKNFLLLNDTDLEE